MPDRAGRRALHRLCASVSGANWRPTLFVDELTLSRYACGVCHVVPSITVVLPCSHALCEQCLTGCVIQDGGSVCPLDTEPFCEDECQRWQLPPKKKENLKAHCWNEADGCKFVGTIEAVLLHYDRECAFHALQCPRCERRILRTGIAAHYVAGCSQNASCESGAQQSRQDGSSTSWQTSVFLDKFSALQRQMDEVSARSQDISRAVSGFENSLQRGMESIEANICTMITRQLNAGLEELRASNPCSDHLSSLQSEMNELVEQSRQRDASQIQEIGRVLRVCESELKEHVNRVEANLSSRLTDQQQSFQTGLDSLQQIVQCTNTEGLPAEAACGKKGVIPWRMEKRLILRKLEIFATESLATLDRLSQHIYRKNDTPWVSEITELMAPTCRIVGNDSDPLCFNVTLGNAEKIFSLQHELVRSSNNWYHRDMLINVTFWFDVGLSKLLLTVDCSKALENTGFPFTQLKVTTGRRSGTGFLPFDDLKQGKCKLCSRRNISHFCGNFVVKKEDLFDEGIVKDGKLTLRFDFQK